MKEKSFLQALARTALAEAKRLGADMAEVVLWVGENELTRFANSMIHQSVASTDSLVHIRVIAKKKISVARSNRLDAAGVKEAVARAVELLSFQQKDPHFTKLPTAGYYNKVLHHYTGAKHIGPLGRARKIASVIRDARSASLSASGAFSEGVHQTYIANSEGVAVYHKSTGADLTTIFTGEKGSGFASQSRKGGWSVDEKAIGKLAVEKATQGKLIDIEPGDYEVILEPAAVAELLSFFGWLGPNARIYHEDVSFFQGNIGKRVFHPSLTITDDPLHPDSYPVSFDYEGAPKEKIMLVDRGVPTNVVYDSYHASKYKKKNTGHALLAPNTWGPVPTHMVVTPGTSTTPDMIKRVKKGLLITRFWYTRVVQYKKLILTGMTRDGTFYIENGAIVGRVKNLRYTESVVEAFKDIRGVGNELSLVGSLVDADEGSPVLTPTLHLGRFRFTSSAKHR